MGLPYKKIGIIGALSEEVAGLVAKTGASLVKSALDTDFYAANYNGRELVIVRCGVGKVNAAIVTQALLDNFCVEAVINVGVAGALDVKVKRNDVVISEKLFEHDMDAQEGAGVIPRMKTSEFVADLSLVREAKSACERVCNRDNFFVGTIVSGDQFICSRQKRQWLSSTFGALCAEMEGAAIAHACYVNATAFLVLRSISDLADEDAESCFAKGEEEAIDYSLHVVLEMLS